MATPVRAGIVEIGDVHAHAGAGFAVLAEGHARLAPPTSLNVPLRWLRYSLLGWVSLATSRSGQPSLVVVQHGDAQRFRTAVEDAARRSDIFECAVAAIAKQPAGLAAIGFGRAVGFVLAVEAAEDVVFGRPLHVVADEQIEQSVAIVVEPERGGAEAVAPAQAGCVGHIDECALAGVPEQRFWPTQVTRMSGKPSLL